MTAARFVVSDKIFFSRVRYGVIRPCGPDANVNPLEACKPAPVDEVILTAGRAGAQVRIAWPASATDYVLEETDRLGANWTAVATPPTVEGEENVVLVDPIGTKFFRLARPAAAP